MGIGVDIVEIDRIKNSIAKHGDRFLKKIYTTKEIEYCQNKAKPEQHYAARFAAKEAIYKAVGDVEFLDFMNVEILNDEKGKPAVHFLNTKILQNGDVEISLSHSREYAVAMVSKVNK